MPKSYPYVNRNLPKQVVYSIFPPGKLDDEISEMDTVKIWGGRILDIGDLKGLSSVEAGTYLWVDGKVPEWVNLCVINSNDDYTEIEIMACAKVVEANATILQPDLHMEPGNPLVPFRIRGPSVADWNVEAGDA